MSNIDKQWLQKKIAEMEDHRDLFPGELDADHASVLSAFRIALASLEAEPVMYVMAGECLEADATSTSKAVVDAWVEEWDQVGEQGYRTVPLYAAPPAPQQTKE